MQCCLSLVLLAACVLGDHSPSLQGEEDDSPPPASCQDYPPPHEPYTLTWTGGPFVWPSPTVRAMYRSAGKFIPRNMIATRAAVFRDELFVIFPRYRAGVCAPLAHTSLLSPNCEATFEPFPCWEAETESECDSLQNPVDLTLDHGDTLWVLDSGVTRTLERPVRRCGPKAVGYDPITGRQKYSVDLSGLTSNSSRLQYLEVEVDSRGRRWLYVADAGAAALLVYDVAADSGYRVDLPREVAAGCPWGQGDVLYLALVKGPRGRNLLLGYLCGRGLYSVNTEDLQAGPDRGKVKRVAGDKPGKMVIIGSDNRHTVYFRHEGEGDVYSWDSRRDLGSGNVTRLHCGDSCLLATHAVIDPLRNTVKVLQSNFLDFLRNTMGLGAVHVFRSIGW